MPNNLFINGIGERSDLVAVPYEEGMSISAFLHTGYYHVHGAAFLYPDKADPLNIVSSAAAWSETGAFTEIIPAGTFVKDFDLHWASISDISATLSGVLDFFAGAPGSEVKIGAVDVVRTVNQSRDYPSPLQIPQQPANTRISCRFSDNTTSSQNVNVKLYGHVYSESLT